MLEKAKRIHGVRVFRKGLGYFLFLIQAMQDYKVYETMKSHLLNGNKIPFVAKNILALGLRMFTDVKHPGIYVVFHPKDAIEIFTEIMRYNSVPQVLADDKNVERKDVSVDRIAADVLDVLIGGGYNWTPDYIFDKIDFYTFYQIKERIDKRKSNEAALAFNIAQNPDAAIDLLNAMKGITPISSWSDPRLNELCPKK